MKKFLKDYFTFNKRDRNGILVLLSLIFILLILLTLMDIVFTAKVYDYSDFDKIVAELEKAQKDSVNPENDFPAPYEKTKNYTAETKVPKVLFSFNPNNLPEAKWKALGLSDKQIKILKNFEAKGGRFYKKQDLKKIYGIQEKLYDRLEPYMEIPAKPVKDYSEKWTNYKKDSLSKKVEIPNQPLTLQTVEINSADTLKLKNLKGIGSAFAKRILSYREKLGGFISFNQLYEVWGMDSETVKILVPQLTLNPSMIRKIALNHCSVTELKKFPYLTYNIANNIVLYRDRHGEYAKVRDICQAVLVNEELFRKIAPYLTLE